MPGKKPFLLDSGIYLGYINSTANVVFLYTRMQEYSLWGCVSTIIAARPQVEVLALISPLEREIKKESTSTPN